MITLTNIAGTLSSLNLNARRALILSICTATLVISGVSTTQGQTNVALVDIGMVFKNHPDFATRLAGLKTEAEQLQVGAQESQRQLMQKAEAIKQYKPGTPEFKAKETELAQESVRLEVEQKDVMRKLMQREAKLHYDTYVEVTNFIADYSERQGIQLVLRYNSTGMEKNNPNSIMQQVNGSVVYHQNQRDITSIIIQQLVQAKGTAKNSATAPMNR